MDQNNNLPASQSEQPPRWSFSAGARNIGNLKRNKYGHIVNGGKDDDDDAGPEVQFTQNRDGTYAAQAGSVFDSPALLEWAKREYKPDADTLFTERANDQLSKGLGGVKAIDATRAAELADALTEEPLDDEDEGIDPIEALKAEAERLASESDHSSTRLAASLMLASQHSEGADAPATTRRFKAASPPPIDLTPHIRQHKGTQVMANFCPECGEEFEDEDKFCSECGTQRQTYLKR